MMQRSLTSSDSMAPTGHGLMSSPWPGSAGPALKRAVSSGSPRDVVAWQTTMTRLDAEERLANEPLADHRLAPAEIVAYLGSLPTLWADLGPEGRQVLIGAIFARTDVLGFEPRVRPDFGRDRTRA
jgi:hypothetical protein